MNNIPIEKILQEYGHVTQEQIQTALAWQREHKGKRIGEVLLDMGFITEAQLLIALGKKMEMDVISVATWPMDMRAVAKIPQVLAQKYNLIAVGFEGDMLVIATDDPLNFYAIEDVNLVIGMPAKYVLSAKQEIKRAVEDCYAEIEAKTASSVANAAVADGRGESGDFPGEMDLREGDQTPVVKLLNSLLVRGYKANASDIHIEPQEDKLGVRMRIDGLLVEYVELEKKLHLPLIARAKIMAGMDIAEKRLPQDGHFKTAINHLEMNIRANTIPTIYGEKIVLRFLNTSAAVDMVQTFGMNDGNYKKVMEILRHPHGIMYITGPTGSGKTTTLYMILEWLAQKPINIVTIEDPVEKNINGVNQMQVNGQAGLTFESGLRAILRQDPDVIMVGETRDSQTAQISVRAAITGHFVLSTLHTNDAVSAIVRMIDMGVEPFLAANSLSGVLAQRLARKICPNCAKEMPATEEEKEILGSHVETVLRGTGCHLCNHTGYKGRIAVHEVVLIDREIRRMITRMRPVEEIYEYVERNPQSASLKADMLRLIREGVTTVDEMVRLTYGE